MLPQVKKFKCLHVEVECEDERQSGATWLGKRELKLASKLLTYKMRNLGKGKQKDI